MLVRISSLWRCFRWYWGKMCIPWIFHRVCHSLRNIFTPRLHIRQNRRQNQTSPYLQTSRFGNLDYCFGRMLPVAYWLPVHWVLSVVWSYTAAGWLGGLVVRTSDSWLAVEGSPPGHDTAWLFISETGDHLWRVNCLGNCNHHLGQLSLASLWCC